jgi:hypothetical protein
VTTGPADEQAAAPRRLRASHGDREQAVSALKAAFVHGRLTSDEFDARVGQALASRTRAELAAITADIPAGPSGVQPAREPNPPALSVKSGVCVTVSAAMLAAVLWAAAWSAGSAAASAAALAVTGVVIFALFVTGYQLRESRHDGRVPPGRCRRARHAEATRRRSAVRRWDPPSGGGPRPATDPVRLRTRPATGPPPGDGSPPAESVSALFSYAGILRG